MPGQEYLETSTNTSWVSCYEAFQGPKSGPERFKQPNGSRFARSRLLISGDGTNRAYAEVKALWKPDPDHSGDCENTTKVVVKTRTHPRFEAVFTQRPHGNLAGSSVQLIDWSPDSRLLVAHLITWVYESEGWSNEMLLYDAQSGHLARVDLSRIFSKHLKRSCAAYGAILGFDPNSRVVFEAQPATDPTDEEVNGPFCGKKRSRWLIDPKTDVMTRLPTQYKTPRYGHFAKR